MENDWSLHLLFAFNLMVIAVNIHHYFVDGRNLEVKQPRNAADVVRAFRRTIVDGERRER